MVELVGVVGPRVAARHRLFPGVDVVSDARLARLEAAPAHVAHVHLKGVEGNGEVTARPGVGN